MTSTVSLSKLHPRQFGSISPTFGAVVGYITGERCTDPAITELSVTADGCVFAATTDDPFFNCMIGTYSDLRRNWDGYVVAAQLDDAEAILAEQSFRAAISLRGVA